MKMVCDFPKDCNIWTDIYIVKLWYNSMSMVLKLHWYWEDQEKIFLRWVIMKKKYRNNDLG